MPSGRPLEAAPLGRAVLVVEAPADPQQHEREQPERERAVHVDPQVHDGHEPARVEPVVRGDQRDRQEDQAEHERPLRPRTGADGERHEHEKARAMKPSAGRASRTTSSASTAVSAAVRVSSPANAHVRTIAQ